MRILSVNNTADIYGASRCMERVFSRFAEAGHEVHAVVPERGPLVALLEARGIRVHVHPRLPIIDRAQLRSFSGGLRFLLQLPVSVLWLAQLMLRLRIDVVHSNTVVIPSPSIAALFTRRRHVWHVRELLGEFGSLWGPYQRVVHRLSDAIVAISRCTRDQFDPSLRNKISVIYDGLSDADSTVTASHRDQLRRLAPEGSTLVGVVGRIKFHRKGQEVLVRAAQLLRGRHPDARYLIVGSASPGNEDQVTHLRALMADLGVEDIVLLAGESSDPASVFAALDIAVVPSVQPEPFGCVVMEAMAVGTPVIGSASGGIAEQIVDGVSGLLFTPGDAESLAVALDRLLSHPELRSAMAGNALRRVRTTFSLDGTYQSMVSLFDSLGGPSIGMALRSTPQ